MEGKGEGRKIIMPLFSNSSQGPQTHFHYSFLHYYLPRLLCLPQVKCKKEGKKGILVIREHFARVQRNDGILQGRHGSNTHHSI